MHAEHSQNVVSTGKATPPATEVHRKIGCASTDAPARTVACFLSKDVLCSEQVLLESFRHASAPSLL
jgi:hypothetical protein